MFEYNIQRELIYNKVKFKKRDLTCDIRLLKIIEINDVEEIKRVLKSKRFSFVINFNNNSKIDYFKIKMKLT